MYQARPYQGEIAVRYHFLTGQGRRLLGMARRYRSTWSERPASPTRSREEMPLVLDVVGGIDRIRPVFGVAIQRRRPLTTYRPGGSDRRGLDRCRRRHSSKSDILGWLRGGMNHVFPDHVRPRVLNRQPKPDSQAHRLERRWRPAGVGLYPSVDFTVVHRDRRPTGFVSFLHASRFLNRNQAFVNMAQSGDAAAGSESVGVLSFRPGIRPDGQAASFETYSRLGVGGASLRVISVKGWSATFVSISISWSIASRLSEIVDRADAADEGLGLDLDHRRR